MPSYVRVGPTNLTIYHGTTVLVTDLAGAISSHSELGLFRRDTRFVSSYDFVINGKKWVATQSMCLSARHSRIYFLNPLLEVLDRPSIPANALLFQVDRHIGKGVLDEELTLTNCSTETAPLRLRIAVDSDFADLFDVRNHRYVSRGVRDSYWSADRHELRIAYLNREFKRLLVYGIESEGVLPHYSNGQLLIELLLAPDASWRAHASFKLEIHDGSPFTVGSTNIEREDFEAAWCASAASIESSSEALKTAYDQAVADIGSLRLHEHDPSHELWVPAAGAPWYLTLFGRDSLIVSYQCMLSVPSFSLGALTKLAQLQARTDDPFRDAEPGKIMHEIRLGELAYLQLIPHTPYYGSADATSLYLIALSELLRWTGNRAFVEQYRPNAVACLEWLERFGDRDHDGFQEYATRSPCGYYNQGWKDSGDGVPYLDGRPAKLPIALCELQGYAYDAKTRWAETFEAFGDGALAEKLRGEAQELRRRFHQAFWLENDGYVALALDGDKRAVASIASNAGHCLWSGILDPEPAAKVAERMFRDDMWSGWGVRTLSAAHAAYNPFDYHRGSVWPHDNGIIAHGLRRYGRPELAARIFKGILDAAAVFERVRLPELFAGLARLSHPLPVQYPRANIPQAWAAGAIIHLLRSLLGIEADAPNNRLFLDPFMPDWLEEVRLNNLQVGPVRLSLRFFRQGGEARFTVLESKGGTLTIEQGPPPWFLGSRGRTP